VSIVTLGTTVILWRFGLFAAIVALYVFLSVDSVITLVAVADTSKMLSALVAALIVAGPGILGVIAYRRLRATAA
jgi:predicted tellurium resistance membrane protein TerC